MKPCLVMLISHGKKNKLASHTHIDYLFKSIGNTGLNSEKRFLVSQSILHGEDFSEYVKNLLKLQESDNHMAQYILSIMNMIEILFMNINSLRTKKWNKFFVPSKIDDAMDDSILQYKLQPMVTSVLDGNVFLVARVLSTNKINIFSIIDWKCIFIFTS